MLTYLSLFHLPGLTNQLQLKYREMKVNNSSLFSRPFHQPTYTTHIFVRPTCKTTRYSGDEYQQETGDVLDIIEKAQPGEKIVIQASAGMGKTYTIANCAIQWQEGNDRLTKYKHVFCLPVRRIRNRSEVIERVICRDLNIVPISYTTSVRLALRNVPVSNSLILIDGYDELGDDEKHNSIIADILIGKIATRSVVVVTTRPNDIQNIKELVGDKYVDITLKRLSKKSIYKYIELAFPNDYASFRLVCRDLTRDYHIFFPNDFVSTPLFLALVCNICRISIQQNTNLDLLYKIRTVGALIATFWGQMIRMKKNWKNGH